MGTVIDFQQAHQRRQQQQAEASGMADLDRALASLEVVIRSPHIAANAILVEHELQTIHRLINGQAIQEATERIQWLRSRLDHASARRSS